MLIHDVMGIKYFFLQTMNDGSAMRRRLLKYILPVFLLSLVFTIPKFFEAKIAYRDVSEISAAGTNVTRVSYTSDASSTKPLRRRRG